MAESNLSKELKLKYQPISVLFTDEKLEDAVEFSPAQMGGPCVILALREAANGKQIYFCETTKGCGGSKNGMGFSNEINTPGGFEYFLSCGRGQGYPPGERLKKNPETAKEFHDNLPKDVMDSKYITLKPVEETDADKAKLVIFLANPDQLSALVTLYQYESGITDDVIAPMSSACASIIKLPLAELRKDKPRAVIGLIDVTVRPRLDADILAFSVPYDAYLKMEENSKDCFFQAKTWNGIKTRL